MLLGDPQPKTPQELEYIIDEMERKSAKDALQEKQHLEMTPDTRMEDLHRIFSRNPSFKSAMAEVAGWFGDINIEVAGEASDAQPIARNGCEFIKWGYFFLECLRCPPDCRDWALAICALSGGNSAEFRIATNKQIAMLIGYSEKTISEKRERFIAWQSEKDWGVIDIQEGGRHEETRHFLPTQYRALLIKYIVEFIESARKRPNFNRNPEKVLDTTSQSMFVELAGEVADNFPNAPFVLRREEAKMRVKSDAPAMPSHVKKVDRAAEAIKYALEAVLEAGNDIGVTAEYLHECVRDNLERLRKKKKG